MTIKNREINRKKFCNILIKNKTNMQPHEIIKLLMSIKTLLN
jgi:hypothetical protein